MPEDIKTGFDDEENEEFVEEDPQVLEIEKLTDPEEIDAAMEILEEELDEISEPFLKEDTSPSNEEPDNSIHSDESDTSLKDDNSTKDEPGAKADESDEAKKAAEDKAKADAAAEKAEEEAGKKADDEFILTDEFIAKQPEENRAILEKYKGKSKAELEKAIANAVMTKSNKDVVQALIDTQKDVGKPADTVDALKEKEDKDEDLIPKELPPLPEDNEEVSKAINARIVGRLNKFAKDNNLEAVPEDTNSPEFKEYLRDLNDDDPRLLRKFNDELEKVESEEKVNAQRFLYVKDNYRKINNSLLISEVEAIKTELKKFGIEDSKIIDADLTLTKDEKGSYYNAGLNSLMFDGHTADENVIKFTGPVPILRKGQLAKKFMFEHNAAILSHVAANVKSSDKKVIENLKGKNLNTLGARGSSGHRTEAITVESIKKLEKNPEGLKKVMDELEDSFEGATYDNI